MILIVATTSLLFIRRFFFEFFLKTHLLLVILLNCLLWFHVNLGINTPTISLSIASFLWVFQTSFWIGHLLYRNACGTSRKGHAIHSLGPNLPVEAVLLNVNLCRPWTVTPGQYVYVTVPSRHRGGIQAHPYLIAWSLEDSNKTSTDISLLIECRDGFSRQLRLSTEHPSSLILDGPYGKTIDLDRFDKVLMIASGVGIAAHLLAIRHLLKAHDSRKARVRRLTLVWILETTGELVVLTMSSSILMWFRPTYVGARNSSRISGYGLKSENFHHTHVRRHIRESRCLFLPER